MWWAVCLRVAYVTQFQLFKKSRLKDIVLKMHIFIFKPLMIKICKSERTLKKHTYTKKTRKKENKKDKRSMMAMFSRAQSAQMKRKNEKKKDKRSVMAMLDRPQSALKSGRTECSRMSPPPPPTPPATLRASCRKTRATWMKRTMTRTWPMKACPPVPSMTSTSCSL